MRKYTQADYRRMPWKNGGGITIQLAIAPEDAGLGNFDWRISTAGVAASGPFSLFAGFDRSLAVLQGAGVALEVDSLHASILMPHNKPLRFRGEQQVHAALLDGPVVDFNVITRRTRWNHTLERLALHGIARCERQTGPMFIYCADGDAVTVRPATGEPLSCGQRDAILIEESDGMHVDLDSPSALLYVARFIPKGSSDAE